MRRIILDNNHSHIKNMLESIIDRYGLDGIYLSSRENIRWASGLDYDYGSLFVLRKGKYFCTDDRTVFQQSSGVNGVFYIDLNNTALSSFLDEHRVKKLGYEDAHLSCRRYEHEKQDFFLHVHLYPVSGAIETLRQVKRPHEIESITYAQKQNHLAYYHIRKNIREGMTEAELALIIHTFFWNQGIFEKSFEPVVLFGERTTLLHEKPGKRRLKANESVLVDFGCKYNGYCSDFARSFFFGTENTGFANAYNVVQEAYKTALSCMKPGIQGKEVDRQVRLALGVYDNNVSHSIAHGVGVELHEKLFINEKCTSVLEQDMVFALEPSVIYQDRLNDRFCIRFEDLVRVTSEGAVNLIELERSSMFNNNLWR